MELISEVKKFETRKNGGARVVLLEYSAFIFSKDEENVKKIIKTAMNNEYDINERILSSNVFKGGKKISKMNIGITFIRDTECENDFFKNILSKVVEMEKMLKKFTVKNFPVSVDFNTMFNPYFENVGAINFIKKEGYTASFWKNTYIKGTLDCNYSIELGKFINFRVYNGNVKKDNFEKAIDDIINDIAYFNNSYYKI